MPALGLLSRLRLKSSSNPGTLKSVEDSDEDGGKDNRRPKSSTKPASPNSRFRSWFSLKRPAKDTGARQPSGRPPTPTPHLVLTSSPCKDGRPKKLKRVRPPSVDGEAWPKDNDEGAGKADERENSAESGEDEHGLTQEECMRLTTFANGVRGLIAELKNAEKESKPTPPMTTENGTPLSPISEADELENEHEPRREIEIAQRNIVRIRSDSSVTELDYGELLDQPQYGIHDDEGYEEEVEDEENALPRWDPDVADLVEMVMSSRHEKMLPPTPATLGRDILGECEGVDEVCVKDDVERIEEVAPETGEQAEAETETEDELEYFSVQSFPVSSGEIICTDEIVPVPDEGLRLQGIPGAFCSDSDSLDFSDSSGDDDDSDNDETIEDYTITSRTPRPSPRRRLPTQPTQMHPMFRPETIDGPSGTGLLLQRQRATTLPVGRERTVPVLPRLSIPNFEGENDLTAVDKGPEELMSTVAKLQREKMRLEQALVHANRKIEQQGSLIASLDSQISKLHAALVRFAKGDIEAPNSVMKQEQIPIVVRPQEVPEVEDDDGPERIRCAATSGLMTPDSCTAVRGGLTYINLSTPPATPDRRAVAALLEGSNVAEDRKDGQDKDMPSSQKLSRGLFRRNSTGASSALAELGIGRAQAQRDAGSEDLKLRTASH